MSTQRTETVTIINTDLAIGAFRAVEIKKLQLEVAEYKLLKALNGTLDMDRYLRVTEDDRARYERKREEYQVRGLLPKEQ